MRGPSWPMCHAFTMLLLELSRYRGLTYSHLWRSFYTNAFWEHGRLQKSVVSLSWTCPAFPISKCAVRKIVFDVLIMKDQWGHVLPPYSADLNILFSSLVDSGRDSCQQDMQGSWGKPREWETDGGVWKTGQWGKAALKNIDDFSYWEILIVYSPEELKIKVQTYGSVHFLLSSVSHHWYELWIIINSCHSFLTLSFLPSKLILTSSLSFPAAGVDPPHHSLAGEPDPREDHGRDAAEAGGLQRLQTKAQTP